MSQFMKLNLQNQLNFYNWQIDLYNDFVIFLESMIAFSVMYFIWVSFYNQFNNYPLAHWLILELIWTLAPIVILLFLGFPSLKMLYMSEIYSFSSMISLKIMGHQWYWEYNFPEYNVTLMSYPEKLLNLMRLIESSVMILPFKSKIRVLISSQDVIHSWAIPSLGFKMDACPGRMNYFMLMILTPGKHFGQCSELCGNYHSWMPIYLEMSSSSLFFEWMKSLN